MTSPLEPSSTEGAPEGETAEQRRRRLAAIFGDVLPETTRDERGVGSGAPSSGEARGDDWLREQVPPHHGG